MHFAGYHDIPFVKNVSNPASTCFPYFPKVSDQAARLRIQGTGVDEISDSHELPLHPKPSAV